MHGILSLPLVLELSEPLKCEPRSYKEIIADVAQYYDPVTQTTVLPDGTSPSRFFGKATTCSDLKYTLGGDAIDESYNCD